MPYLTASTLVWLGTFTQAEVGVLFVPLALNEMVLAVWLLLKGVGTIIPATSSWPKRSPTPPSTLPHAR